MKVLLLLLALVAFAAASPYSLGDGLRIFNGSAAAPGQFPYQVAVVAIDDASYICGGALLNKRFALTAACMDVWQNVSLSVGSVDRTNGTLYPGFMIDHEEFDDSNGRNNIALVKTREEIQFNDWVQPIPLRRTPVAGGVNAVVSSWGRTNMSSSSEPIMLRYLNLHTVDNALCPFEDDQQFDGILCAFSQKGQGMCYGDAGSPLVVDGELVGIVSKGVPCATGVPDEYTRVSYYISWIEEHMKI